MAKDPVAVQETSVPRPAPIPADALALHDMDVDLTADSKLETYRPNVCASSKEWVVSETDVAFMAEGVGVLGTGKCNVPTEERLLKRIRWRRICSERVPGMHPIPETERDRLYEDSPS